MSNNIYGLDAQIVKFNEQGLVPAIAVDAANGDVLMLAYMNMESLELTLNTEIAHYYSRSRQSLWKKGETSGNIQKVISISIDCDEDTLLLRVDQTGAACHTGNRSCFYRTFEEQEKIAASAGNINYVIRRLYDLIGQRRDNPVEGSYTNYLFDKGIDKILKKVGEESAEVIIAAKNHSKAEMTYEISDLVYHTLVLMVEEGVQIDDILLELQNREK